MRRPLIHAVVVLAVMGPDGARPSDDVPPPVEPRIAAASDEGLDALATFRLDHGLVGSLFAAEPLVANPVAFHVDAQGRVFVCESFRQNRGVTDNRGHDDAWLDSDLAAQTVEDRREYHLRLLGEQASSYTEQDDRIRVLRDTDGDHVADQVRTFAKGFNSLVEGTGAGVLEHQGRIYYTCIPNLWIMTDTDGDDQADDRQALHSGYGVRVAFRGHDLHGLRVGPDGRLYFSIGDRGANVETPTGRLVNVESGSVFRCELDGSNLEIFATGLRNPQELVFDDFGNLFTCDNNSDSGDMARWVYVVEGGDSGWRMAYQYLRDRGPFNREGIWRPLHHGQPAYIVPPVINISDGPSGLDYYPGTGFPENFRGRFFLCDFRGAANQSGVRSFYVEPEGAFFRLTGDDQPIWNLLATDLQFAPDGGLYVSDWVEGWNGEGKGRLYRFHWPDDESAAIVAEVRRLLAEPFTAIPSQRLIELLGHDDQRVRFKSQYELASRRAVDRLRKLATTLDSRLLARLHALWALDQIGRSDTQSRPAAIDTFAALLGDSEDEVRAHATRLLGELAATDQAAAIRRQLSDENARVRYFAMVSLRKLGDRAAFVQIVEQLARNENRDPILRHGGVLAMAQLGCETQLSELKTHESAAVRLAAVVALRRRGSASVTDYLDDRDPRVVAEAARAIHDEPIPAGLTALAQLIQRDLSDDAVLRRVLNANFRLGGQRHANALAQFAAQDSSAEGMRLEAVMMLGEWAEPSSRDRVLGMWRPIESRSAQGAAEALRPVVATLSRGNVNLRLEVARVAGELGIDEAAPVLAGIVDDPRIRGDQRAEALTALGQLTGQQSMPVFRKALEDPSPVVRAAALELVARIDPDHSNALLEKFAREGETIQRQTAIRALGTPSDARGRILVRVLQNLVDDQLPPELHLDALTAASHYADHSAIDSLVSRYEATRNPDRIADGYRETLHGGNSQRGRTIFFERASVSCVRCHIIFGQGGEVGPELTRIAADKTREYLLEAIVDPNATIAKNFESAKVLDEFGRTHVGVVKSEDQRELVLVDAYGKETVLDKSSIEDRAPSKSGMPEDVGQHLTKSEIRDLVEFLANLGGRRRFFREN